MIVVGGVLLALTGLLTLLILLGITRDLDALYIFSILNSSLIILAGIFIAVSYSAKTYAEGFQEALAAVTQRVSNDLKEMKEKIKNLEK